jgi:rhodanese-related sulfurtransferase
MSRPTPQAEPPFFSNDQASKRNRTRVLFLLSRLFLGGIFVYASYDKILHPVPFAEIVYNYQILPDVLVNPASLFLPWIELLVGLSLILRIWMPGAVLISNLLLMVFFSTLVFNMARGLDIDCGCFAASAGPSSGGLMPWYLVRDGLFLFVGVFVFYCCFFLMPTRRSSFDRLWNAPFLQTAALALFAALLGIILNQARSNPIPLPGDWSPEARITLKFGKNILIPFEEAKDKFLTGSAVFLDARPSEHYQESHIQGARNLPVAEFDQLADKVFMEFSEDTLFVAYCDGGDCALSSELALKLKRIGFENVRILYDGWNVWKSDRLPIQSSRSQQD